MENAHLRLGLLEYVRFTEKTSTPIRLRVTTAADAANIVAEMDGVLRNRESEKSGNPANADEIFAHMSA